MKVATWVLLVQSVIGLVQGIWMVLMTGTFLGSTGDAVEGTIHLPLAPSGAFSNPMFAANIAFLMVLLLPSVLQGRKPRLTVASLVLGGISLIMASVVHVLMFTAISLVVGSLINFSRTGMRALFRWIVVAAAAGSVAVFLIGPNVATVASFAAMFERGELPRAQVWSRVVTDLPEAYPYLPYVGLGPGQFSSRAGMIASGLYATTGPLDIAPRPTDAQQRFLLDAYRRSLEGHPLGSTGQPLSSWLSVYTEFGGIVAIGLLGWGIIAVARKTFSLLRRGSRVDAWSFVSGSALFLLLGFQENYWETAQATMVGLVVIKYSATGSRGLGPVGSASAPRSEGDAS